MWFLLLIFLYPLQGVYQAHVLEKFPTYEACAPVQEYVEAGMRDALHVEGDPEVLIRCVSPTQPYPAYVTAEKRVYLNHADK